MENELVRRWNLQIEKIEITNTCGKTIEPFLQFIIGGNFFVRI
jgi:hypothetical protein